MIRGQRAISSPAAQFLSEDSKLAVPAFFHFLLCLSFSQCFVLILETWNLGERSPKAIYVLASPPPPPPPCSPPLPSLPPPSRQPGGEQREDSLMHTELGNWAAPLSVFLLCWRGCSSSSRRRSSLSQPVGDWIFPRSWMEETNFLFLPSATHPNSTGASTVFLHGSGLQVM